ncbi:hypothetical protein JQ599_24710 [Bradyrhizobium diazoefficiens]|nr:hypothetical protein [Bradyrhizobium diazoefficiens]MBR0703126.1 hypothetical protein [Bradyrhizobium diazoefficiens]MBR0771881.1 hypothetical protein [Bradyrhizobium diazoefficiens]
MVLAETVSGLGAVKTAFDMAKALQSIHDTTARDRAVIDLQREILAAQEAQFSLVDRVRELEKEVAGLKAWEADKQRYKLVELAPHVVVYSLKPEMANGEPPHELCTACYAAGFKSLLKKETWNPGRCEMVVCHGCGWYAYIHGMADPLHKNHRPKPYRE